MSQFHVREFLKTPLGRKMRKYSVVGAVVAIPLPIVGPVIGAIAGAGLAYARRDKN